MAEIVLDGISKRYADGTEALGRTDLTIGDGELFILVGPSGCGKSTLLKLIVGLERPSSGEIRVGDRMVTHLDSKDRNMAMVFQSYAIYPHMTVRENMAFPLKLAKLGQQEIARRVEQAAQVLELTELLGRKPAALSGGQRQRVAMGRAIVREPAAFLLDEPLSNLDAKLRAQMRIELARLQRRLGTTMVYVTHDQTEAMTLGERIAVLRRGAIQQVGTPRDLYLSPANLFVAGFIGSPAMNLLPAAVDGDRLRLPMADLPLPPALRAALPAGPRHLVAGIRPEHVGEAVPADDAGNDSGAFGARVELLEWLGADLYLHCDVLAQSDEAPTVDRGEGLATLRRELDLDAARSGPPRLVVRVGSDTRVAEGDTVKLSIPPERLLLFDAESGERIESG
jgi:multiple sugar transport system ATP-binding protein